MTCDELPLPHFVLRTATKIAPDDLLDQFRILRAYKLRFWESLLGYYVLAPVLIEQRRRSLDPPKAEALLCDVAPLLEACKSLRSGLSKTHSKASRVVAAAAKALAPNFAVWDQDHEHAASWLGDLEASRDGQQMVHLADVIYETRSYWRVGSPPLRRHVDAAGEASRAYTKLHGELVVANLRLVVSAVKRLVYKLTSPEDLGSEAVFGLIKAVHRFDPDRGHRFSTFAVHWLRHYVMRKQQDDDLIRLPVHMQEKANRINRARRRYVADNGSDPSIAELLGLANSVDKKPISASEILLLDRRESSLLSMSQPVGIFEDDDSTLIDILPDRSPSIEHEFSIAEIRAEVEQILATMKPSQADAFRQVAGLIEDETLASIGERHHLSRERIRQLSLDAADEIRRHFRRRATRCDHLTRGKGGGVGPLGGGGDGREIGGPRSILSTQ